jgi:predicted nucleotidyltransferase
LRADWAVKAKRMKVASVEAIVRTLNEHAVRFLVVGGIAVNAHGHGRTTFDLDLVIQLLPENIRRAFAALRVLGYSPLVPITADEFTEASNRARWKREKGMFVLQFHSDLHRQTRVDVFVEEPFDFDAEHSAAFQAEITPELPVRILRLEALIRMKEATGRSKDIDDVQHLLWSKETRRNDP